MTTKATERGRSLIVEFGDENEPGFRRVTVAPIPAKLGAALYALWAGIAFGQSDHPEIDAVSMGKLAVGEENWKVLDEELRWQESQDLIHAAFFWNVQGGGIDLVNIMLEQKGATGGYPKAQETLVGRNGHSKAFGLLKTLLSSDEATETPVTGRFERYEYPAWFRELIQAQRTPGARPKPTDTQKPEARTVSERKFWGTVYAHWDRYTLPDLREYFQVDAYSDSPDMDRPWRWLRGFILALADIPESRIARALEQ